MLTETVKAEIRRLIDAIDEDGPSSRLFSQLEQTLAGEPGARRYYLRLMGLRSNLRQIAVASEIEHRDKGTPYLGLELKGVVNTTFVRGKKVFQNGTFLGSPSGVWLRNS